MTMRTKNCTGCGKSKKLSEFHKQKDGKFGVRPDCKVCIKEYQIKNKTRIQKVTKAHRIKNKEKIQVYNKKYHIKNKEFINKKHKKYYQENKEKESLRAKEYRKKNLKRQTELHTIYTRERRQKDPSFRLLCNLRNRMCDTISKGQKSLSTMFLIGCEIDYLMFHIQEQFTSGMSWDNYGDWHMDHIKPCSLFDLSKPSEQRKCFNYSNLQPLWAIDNLRKGSKIKQENL